MEEPIHFVIGSDFPAERLVTEIVPTLLQSVFVGWAIFWIVAEWPSDLIQARRGLRFLFLLIVGVNMLLAGLFQRVVVPTSEIANYFVHMVLIGFYTLVVCVVLVRTLSSDSAHLLQQPVENRDTRKKEAASQDSLSTPASTKRSSESATKSWGSATSTFFYITTASARLARCCLIRIRPGHRF